MSEGDGPLPREKGIAVSTSTFGITMPTACEIDALRYSVNECAENCKDMVEAVEAAYKDLNETIEDMIDTLWELQYSVKQVNYALGNESKVVWACDELDAEIEGVKENLEDDNNNIDRRTKAEIEKLLKGDNYKNLDNLLKILGTIS